MLDGINENIVSEPDRWHHIDEEYREWSENESSQWRSDTRQHDHRNDSCIVFVFQRNENQEKVDNASDEQLRAAEKEWDEEQWDQIEKYFSCWCDTKS